jgi:hypothetical protein
MMRQANAGALWDEPGRFLSSSAAAAWKQFIHFEALDDECPEVCGSEEAALLDAVRDHRPGLLPQLQGSRQLRGEIPHRLVRAVTTPVAALSLLLVPLFLFVAWRKRDPPALSLLLALVSALAANAAMAGALSDVHDRYQSRIVWLALFALLGLALRWRSFSEAPAPRR